MSEVFTPPTAEAPGLGGPPMLGADVCLLMSGRVAGDRLAADLTAGLLAGLRVEPVAALGGVETDLVRLDLGLVS
jgi:hypothetical protein